MDAYYRYKKEYEAKQPGIPETTPEVSGASSHMPSNFRKPERRWKFWRQAEHSVSIENEALGYFREDRTENIGNYIDDFQSYKSLCPVLCVKAKDFLAIPAMSAASET